MRITAVVACFLLGATFGLAPGAAVAQDDPPAGGQREQSDAAADQRRDDRRAWLTRRLEESRAEQARLENMLRRLDAGEPLPEVRRPQREGRDGAEGPDARQRADGNRQGGDRGRRRPEQRADEQGEGRTPPLEERIRLVLRFARKHVPEFAERLESDLERDPGAAHRIAARFWPRLVELEELETSQPELFTVEVERLRSGQVIMNVIHRARSSAPHDAAARQRLVEHLRPLAERHFELRVEAVRLRLESLRQSVRETERELEEHRADRERSVEEQVQRLLRIIDQPDGDDGERREGRRRDGGGDRRDPPRGG